MAHVEKFSAQAVVNQLRHIERKIAHPANDDICPEKENLNYSLVSRNISSYDYFLKRKSELYCYGRDDVKVLGGWVVTVPAELPAEQHRDFFCAVHEFLVNRYGGEQNCIQSIVHNDESGQPHLHFLFLPCIEDKKHGGEKLCMKDVINRQELRNFHPALQKFMTEEKGFDVNLNSGITKIQGNRSVRELKQERTYQHEHSQTIEIGRW